MYRNARFVSTAFIYSSTGPFSGQQINKQNAQRARFIGGPLAERQLLEAARPIVPILWQGKI